MKRIFITITTLISFALVGCLAVEEFESSNPLDPTSQDYAGSTSGNGSYSVTYDGNGHTLGTVPVDSTSYESASAVTVK